MAYCTLEEVKAYLDMKTEEIEKDAFIESLIPGSQELIDEYCNRKFEREAITEYHDGGSNRIFLNQFPVAASPAIQIWDSWDRTYANPDLIDPDDYFVDYEGGIIKFDYEVGGSPGAIKVVYTGGPATVPYGITQACIELTARKFKDGPSGGLGTPSRALPGIGGNVTYITDSLLPQTKILLDTYRKVGSIS